MLIGNIAFSFHSLKPLILKTITFTSEDDSKAVFYALYEDNELMGFTSSIGRDVTKSELDIILESVSIPMDVLNQETHEGLERICLQNTVLSYCFMLRLSTFLGSFYLKG